MCGSASSDVRLQHSFQVPPESGDRDRTATGRSKIGATDLTARTILVRTQVVAFIGAQIEGPHARTLSCRLKIAGLEIDHVKGL
jgi:hypothetical protein